jgi:hypothetical protein
MKPAKHTMTVLKQVGDSIPAYLVPKLARKHGVDKKSRTFTPWNHVQPSVVGLYEQLQPGEFGGFSGELGFELRQLFLQPCFLFSTLARCSFLTLALGLKRGAKAGAPGLQFGLCCSTRRCR